ncbi:FkbM family methyltransferase [Candidatus Thioglobus sp.]|nr:FkbM family methyltransferase [Candidatus Thioglobus sp.]
MGIFSSKVIKMPLNKKVNLLDVGARDGIGWPWNTMQEDTLDVILVEPDPVEAKALKDQGHGRILPYALWNGETTLTLNINNSPGTSSVFEANMPFLQQFDDSQRFEVKDKITLKTKTIDNLAKNNEIDLVDFVKIDVQGGELAILQGGEKFFKKNIVGLEAEVEFAPMYKDQPLFSDIDVFAREKLGLELWDISKVHWKYQQKNYKTPLKGRLIFGDALYLRPISTLNEWLSAMDKEIASEKLHALIATTIAYGFLDYTFAIINTSFSKEYLSKKEEEIIAKHLRKISSSVYPFKNGSGLLSHILNILMYSFKPTHEGWANGESRIGSKKTLFFWWS